MKVIIALVLALVIAKVMGFNFWLCYGITIFTVALIATFVKALTEK